ncbi:hypothetical protein AMS68_006934 [Peltaster fructicola]|uniref:Alpha/beta hydrolase fold-3 domain-containing protein n=1 Tax=Peltaster fructicola TaxID=286661 RepID=A0A6H0Y338_9PEZI|nr:hypothetical protein AMS68_006934 [Peltaster fructicola]
MEFQQSQTIILNGGIGYLCHLVNEGSWPIATTVLVVGAELPTGKLEALDFEAQYPDGRSTVMAVVRDPHRMDHVHKVGMCLPISEQICDNWRGLPLERDHIADDGCFLCSAPPTLPRLRSHKRQTVPYRHTQPDAIGVLHDQRSDLFNEAISDTFGLIIAQMRPPYVAVNEPGGMVHPRPQSYLYHRFTFQYAFPLTDSTIVIRNSVHTPLVSSASARPAAVLYFPRGPILPDAATDEEVVKTLRSTLPYPIVQVEYSREQQHPDGIYDTLAAFDWAIENVLPARTGRWTGKNNHSGRIATCGELFGGTLATMLALTECRAGQAGVVAAAVNNPVLDWTDIGTRRRHRGRKSKKTVASDAVAETIPSAQLLQIARDRLFNKPEHYYDTFGSPMLLFRSAGSSPPAAPPSPQEDELQFYDHDELHESPSTPEAVQTEVELRPRSSRQFPSRAHGLTLPAFQITTGSSSSLAPQAEEFTHQLRQSMLRQRRGRVGRRTRWTEDDFYDHEPPYTSEEELAEAEADYLDSRVQSTVYPGSGLWSDGPVGQAMIHSMANWLRQRLE